ncbi:MAG: hypothetical protein AAF089_04240 [Bacteroidota bacterium]
MLAKKLLFIPFLLTSIYSVLVAEAARAQGPSQPEAMRFEAVDITDMVNLATGDFVYALPLISVPGPEGSYPVSMSYRAGIGPNMEATWVGLGWVLNPGAINRVVNGYADEFKGGDVITHFRAEGEREYAISVGVSVGTPFSSVGLNATYNVNSGKMGVNAVTRFLTTTPIAGIVALPSLSLSGGTSGFSVGINGGIRGAELGARVSVATDGAMSASGSWSYGGVGISAGPGGLSGRIAAGSGSNAVGFNISSNGMGASYAGGSFGSFSQSRAGAGTIEAKSFGLPPIELGILRIDLGFSTHQWKLDEKHYENSYGYASMEAYRTSSAENRKFERVLISGRGAPAALHPAQDNYIVGAQGLDGSFSPFVRDGYTLRDGKEENEQGQLQLKFGGDYDVVYRFLGDTGGNLVSTESRWGRSIEQIMGVGSGSVEDHVGTRRIDPHFDDPLDPFLLTGFTIKDRQGKIYEFKQPVYSNFEYSWTNDDSPPNINYVNNTTQTNTKYATQWLITSIKGPDYVDRGNDGMNNEDWGYWVKFKYEDPEINLWRAPFQQNCENTFVLIRNCLEYNYDKDDVDIKSYSWGQRESVYLSSIETATHMAKFELSSSYNRSEPLGAQEWANGVRSEVEQIDGDTFRIEGNLSSNINDADLDAPIFYAANPSLGSPCTKIYYRRDMGPSSQGGGGIIR